MSFSDKFSIHYNVKNILSSLKLSSFKCTMYTKCTIRIDMKNFFLLFLGKV